MERWVGCLGRDVVHHGDDCRPLLGVGRQRMLAVAADRPTLALADRAPIQELRAHALAHVLQQHSDEPIRGLPLDPARLAACQHGGVGVEELFA